MTQVRLDFNHSDDGLNLEATVNFPRQVPVSRLTVAGLAEWRHVPANMVHFNQEALEVLKLSEKAKNLSKVGVGYMGIKARTNILLSFNVRKGRNGTENVKKQLTKLFKALGATSVKFTAVTEPALAGGDFDDDFNG